MSLLHEYTRVRVMVKRPEDVIAGRFAGDLG
jgi:hypothetical protein